MQRRAAAAYLALFLVVMAGAYAVIGVAEEPEIELDGPTYSNGDALTVDERVYNASDISNGTGALQWTDPDATQTVNLENNSTVSWQVVSWDGQAVESTTLDAGSTIGYNGSLYRVDPNATAQPPTLTLVEATDDSINDTYERGDMLSVTVDGEYHPDRTITEITESSATIAVGDDYRVLVPNESDPDSASLTQQLNVTRLLVEEPTLDNQTFVGDTGVELVRNKTTGETSPLSEFLPDPEVREIEEGDTLRYEGNETTVGNITTDGVPLTRTVPTANSVELEEGDTVPLGPDDREFLVHFPDDSSVQIIENTSSNWEAYQTEKAEIDNYHERMSGLWGVVILSFAGALLLGGAAYLPVKD